MPQFALTADDSGREEALVCQFALRVAGCGIGRHTIVPITQDCRKMPPSSLLIAGAQCHSIPCKNCLSLSQSHTHIVSFLSGSLNTLLFALSHAIRIRGGRVVGNALFADGSVIIIYTRTHDRGQRTCCTARFALSYLAKGFYRLAAKFPIAKANSPPRQCDQENNACA